MYYKNVRSKDRFTMDEQENKDIDEQKKEKFGQL